MSYPSRRNSYEQRSGRPKSPRFRSNSPNSASSGGLYTVKESRLSDLEDYGAVQPEPFHSPDVAFDSLRRENEERRQKWKKKAEKVARQTAALAEAEEVERQAKEAERWQALMARREESREALELKRRASMEISSRVQPGASKAAARLRKGAHLVGAMTHLQHVAAATAAASPVASVSPPSLKASPPSRKEGLVDAFADAPPEPPPASAASKPTSPAANAASSDSSLFLGGASASAAAAATAAADESDPRARIVRSLDAMTLAVQKTALGSPAEGNGWTGGALSMSELAELARAARGEDEEAMRRLAQQRSLSGLTESELEGLEGMGEDDESFVRYEEMRRLQEIAGGEHAASASAFAHHHHHHHQQQQGYDDDQEAAAMAAWEAAAAAEAQEHEAAQRQAAAHALLQALSAAARDGASLSPASRSRSQAMPPDPSPPAAAPSMSPTMEGGRLGESWLGGGWRLNGVSMEVPPLPWRDFQCGGWHYARAIFITLNALVAIFGNWTTLLFANPLPLAPPLHTILAPSSPHFPR